MLQNNNINDSNNVLIKNSIANIFERLKNNFLLSKEEIFLSMKEILICNSLEDYSNLLVDVMIKNKLEWTTTNSIFFYLFKKELYTLDYLLFNTIEEIYNETNNKHFYKFIINYNHYFNTYYLCIVSVNNDKSFSIKLCSSSSNLNTLNEIVNYLTPLLENNIFLKMDKIAFEANKNKILNELFLLIDINEEDYFVSKFNYDFSKLYENQYDDFFDDENEIEEFENELNFEINYYEILGIEKNSSIEEIKKAYRQKAKEWHPDICKKDNAEEMFKQINQAFKILKNEEKRKEYDESLF